MACTRSDLPSCVVGSQATYIDGKGYKETVSSVGTALTTLPGNINTAPFVVPQQQLTGIPDTTGIQGSPVDFFVPFTTIFTDNQTASNALIYTATLADGTPLISLGLLFAFDPVTGAAHFSGTLPADFTGPLSIRVTATDNGPGVPLSVTDTFVINVLPTGTPPIANNDSYTVVENTVLSVPTANHGVLSNDTDPSGNKMSAQLVAGPLHGTLTLNLDGTFAYTPVLNFSGADSFTYKAIDVDFAAPSNLATVSLAITPDTVAPATPIFGGFTDTATATALTGYTLSGTAEAGSKVTLSDGGALTLGIVTAAANGAWSFAIAPATPNNILSKLTVTAADAAGNVSAGLLAGLIVGTGANDSGPTALSATGAFAGIPNLIVGLGGNDVLTGGAGTDRLEGGAGADILDGGKNLTGADTLIGGAGDDTFIVRNLGDVVVELVGGGNDTVLAAVSNYTLAANVGVLTFIGTGNFVGIGNEAADLITGGAGADILDGGKNLAGVDTLVGGAGDDTFIIRNLGDVVVELVGGGTDNVLAAVTSYTLTANVGNLTFIGTGAFTGVGNEAANVITGGAGADSLNGVAGNDTLVGGGGADTLTGGTGSDTFVLARGDANDDVITDFSHAGANGADHISLTGYVAGATLLKTVIGTAIQPTSYAVQIGGITQDTFKLTGNVTLVAADFNFA